MDVNYVNRQSKSRYNDERSQFDHSNRFHYVNTKREFRDEDRIKRKEDRHSVYNYFPNNSYRDYNNYDKRKGRDRMEDLKRM